jgi:predicted  nucleic acid-binding Zn-ribbon protein
LERHTVDKIFISYRRDDSAAAAAKIYDALNARFGPEHVFRDVDTIEAGADFAQQIRQSLKACKVQLVVIGPQWLTIKGDDGKRRLDAQDDFVRIEVESAFQRNIRVIPLLINGTPMPRLDELPESLVRLSRCQARRIHTTLYFNADIERVISDIAETADFAPPPTIERMRAAMDVALSDELEALRKDQRNGRGGHTAINGKLIGVTEGAPLYEFELEGLWEPQEDTPLSIVLPDRRNLTATLVTTTGARITISASAEIPEAALKKIKLIPDTSGLVEALRDALRETDETVALLGAKTFRLVPGLSGFQSVIPKKFPGTPPQFPGDSQQKALKCALGNEIGYIIGPPGTGKTQTLAAIAYTHLVEGRTVLIAAHTNIAVDNAMLELAKLCKGRGELEEGRIIRYGAPMLKEVRDNEYIYPPKIAARLGLELERKKRAIEEALADVDMTCKAGDERVQRTKAQWTTERRTLDGTLSTVNAELQDLRNTQARQIHDLERRFAQVDGVLVKAEEELAGVRATLGELAGNQTKLKGLRDAQILEVKRCEERLRRAQQMNALLRWFQRIDLKALQQRLGELQYGVYTLDSRLQGLAQDIDAAHRRRGAIDQRLRELRETRNQLEQEKLQLRTASPRVAELEGQTQQLRARVDTGDERVRQEAETWQRQRAPLQSQMQTLRSQLADIVAELAGIEKQLVEKARVIGTTLTKTYLGAATRHRRFEAIIIDEASIAPMPAVYVVASRANEYVTIVGDPCQLAPISKAETTAAKTWLKTDVFGRLNLTIAAASAGSQGSVLLDTQFRMHPSISRIPARHVYHPYLKDGMKAATAVSIEPKPTSPLVLCDTSRANPQATKPPNGRSRLTEYHALCSVKLTDAVLGSLPATPEWNGEPRVGVIAPYAPHAARIQRLINENLDATRRQLVRVGTIHSFQGLQFDVVIFDTVESPPITPFFVAGGLGTEAMRLVNVAVTRPKHKLIIVANVAYLRRMLGPKATLILALDEVPLDAVMHSSQIVSANPDKSNRLGTLGTLPDAHADPSTPKPQQLRSPLTAGLTTVRGSVGQDVDLTDYEEPWESDDYGTLDDGDDGEQ